MKILYIHNDYALPSGEEHAAQGISDLLTKNGHEIQWFRRSSAELADSPFGKAKGFFAGIHNPRSARVLDQVLSQDCPDVVQVQNVYPLISPSIFPVLSKHHVPVVMRCPNYRLFCPGGLHLVDGEVCERCLGKGREFWCMLKNCQDNWFKSCGYAMRNAVARLLGRMKRSVHVYMVQSQFQKEKFIQNGIPADRIEILPGMVQMCNPPVSRSLGDYVSFVGRISPEKGIEQFLEAARHLPEIPFAIAGDVQNIGPLCERSPANVRWLGFLSGDRLRELYVNSRLVVVPSRWYEGFPNVLVQAMMLGIPTVVSSVGSLPEIVGHGSAAAVYDVSDVGQLVSKIRNLYTRPSLCVTLGNAGRIKAESEYTAKACYDRLMNIYKKAITLNKLEEVYVSL